MTALRLAIRARRKSLSSICISTCPALTCWPTSTRRPMIFPGTRKPRLLCTLAATTPVKRWPDSAAGAGAISVASRLFRHHGFDGIGLKDLMKSAGLTQGAFYKQFGSKGDLAAQASNRAFEGAADRWSRIAAANHENPLGAVIASYLSTDHRDE